MHHQFEINTGSVLWGGDSSLSVGTWLIHSE